jgi:hypothetical protein
MSKRKVYHRSFPYNIKMEPHFTSESIQSLHDVVLIHLGLILFIHHDQTATATEFSIPSDAHRREYVRNIQHSPHGKNSVDFMQIQLNILSSSGSVKRR